MGSLPFPATFGPAHRIDAADRGLVLSTRNANLGRCVELDVFKTFLVVGMVFAHVVQIVQSPIDGFTAGLSNVINLVSFPGFLFAFGWGTALSCRDRPVWERLQGPAKILLAFYLSGIGAVILTDGNGWSAARILGVVTLTDLPGHSEFLASFFVLSLAMVWLGRGLGHVVRRPACLVACLAASAAFGCIPFDGPDLPWLAIVLPAPGNTYFPLAPYAMWLFLGASYADRTEPFGRIDLCLAASATYTLLAVALITGSLPSRFPPSTLWVIGPALFLLLYRAASMAIVRRIAVPRLWTGPGRHVLVHLVASNLSLFAIQSVCGPIVRNPWEAAALTIVLIAAITGFRAALTRAMQAAFTLAPT
jgi:hypothetical protein